MKTTTEYDATGRFRFNHHEPLPYGKYFMHQGVRVKLVGSGIAGIPEVETADGYSYVVFPHELEPCAETHNE